MNDPKLFLAKVEEGPSPTGCWLWSGALGIDGYGRVRRRGKTHSAHRYAYELFKGEIPEGLHVLHACDTPRCVNPQHLFLGTPQDNAFDRRAKKRQGYSARKLSWEDVQDIRAALTAGSNKRDVAARFRVCRSTVQDIANGACWTTQGDPRQLQLF